MAGRENGLGIASTWAAISTTDWIIDCWKDSISPARLYPIECNQLGGLKLVDYPDDSSWLNSDCPRLFLDRLPDLGGVWFRASWDADEVEVWSSCKILVDRALKTGCSWNWVDSNLFLRLRARFAGIVGMCTHIAGKKFDLFDELPLSLSRFLCFLFRYSIWILVISLIWLAIFNSVVFSKIWTPSLLISPCNFVFLRL